MNDNEFLERYFEICKGIWEEMEADGTWPWAAEDQASETTIESK